MAQSAARYGGRGRGRGVGMVGQVNTIAAGGQTADVTFFLDLDVDTALQRRRRRDGGREDRLEQAGIGFQATVRQAFLVLAKETPQQSLVADADIPADDLAQHVYQALLDRFPQFPFRDFRK